MSAKRIEPGPASDAGGGDQGDSSDAALVSASVSGDDNAYRALVERHLPFVRRVARGMLRETSEADDVAQDAFLRLWRNMPALEADGRGVKSWLRRVTANLCIDRIRSRKGTIVTAEPPDQVVEPDQIAGLSRQELSARVDLALLELPDRQRLALLLFQFEGLSQREIGDAMSISQDAVESLLARARRHLKVSLRDEWRQLLGEAEA